MSCSESNYQNGALRDAPKGSRKDGREVSESALLPTGDTGMARQIADRRVTFTAERVARLLERLFLAE